MSWNVILTARAAVEAGERGRVLLQSAGCRVSVADPLGPLPSAALAEAVRGHDAVVASSDAYDAPFFASPAVAGTMAAR
jgi:hypothetical protein